MQTDGLKVLIIEDRRENIVFLANNIFKPKGFNIITARDGTTGLRKVLEEHPDLIILDLNIPKMHGLDILADLQDRRSLVPVITMAFHGAESVIIQAFRLGARDYVAKPLGIEMVNDSLNRVLATSTQSGRQDSRQIRNLEAKIIELEKTIEQQKEQLSTLDQPEEITQDIQQAREKQRKIIQEQNQQRQHLQNRLNEQEQLIAEAQNRASALTQFIIAQQKEMMRQKRYADALTKQVTALASDIAKFTDRLDRQTHQFQLVSLNPESE